MKNYIKPSIELNKFEVEDIITTSGVITTDFTQLSQEAQDIYTASGETGATTFVEFEW